MLSDCFLVALSVFMFLLLQLVCELLDRYHFILHVRMIWLLYFLSHDYQGWYEEKTFLYRDCLTLSLSHAFIHGFNIYWCTLCQILGQTSMMIKKKPSTIFTLIEFPCLWQSFIVKFPERVVCICYHWFPFLFFYIRQTNGFNVTEFLKTSANMISNSKLHAANNFI